MALKSSQSEKILREPFSIRKYGSDKTKNTLLNSDFAEYLFKEKKKRGGILMSKCHITVFSE